MGKGTNPASESIKHAQKTGGKVIMQTTDRKETLTITPDKNITGRPTKGTQSGHTVTSRGNSTRRVGNVGGSIGEIGGGGMNWETK